MKLKNSYKYFYSILGQFLMLSFVVFVFIFYKYNYSFEFISESIETTLIAMAFTSPFFIIPLVILFLNYWYYNKNSSFNIKDGVFSYDKGKYNVSFSVSEIEQVTIHMNNVRRGSFPSIFFWQQYFYSKWELKNGTSIIVTCLLNDEIEFLIPSKLIKVNKRIIPLIKTDRVEIKEYNDRVKKINKEKLDTLTQTKKFKEKFKEKTIEELQTILYNKNKYQKEAIIAAEILLKEKVSLN